MKTYGSSDIIALEENKVGRDFIIGDVHGNSYIFQLILNRLNDKDRLFIVGDLVDRGPDSPGVIALVLQRKHQIFTTLGNHETDSLEAIESLEVLVTRNIRNLTEDLTCITESRSLPRETRRNDDYKDHYKCLLTQVKHGGTWIIKLFLEEFNLKKIRLENSKVYYSEDSMIGNFKKYTQSLPFIIYVAGKKPFKVVHADMPFEDDELLKRIKESSDLSSDEQHYVTWARIDNSNAVMRTENRNPRSIITYVGHSQITKERYPILRPESNTVNIDIACYYYNIGLVINHTLGTSEFINFDNPLIAFDTKLIERLKTIKSELDKYFLANNQNSDKKRAQDEHEASENPKSAKLARHQSTDLHNSKDSFFKNANGSKESDSEQSTHILKRN